MATQGKPSISGVSGTKRDVIAKWTFTGKHLDHFAYIWYYHTSKNGWIEGARGTCDGKQHTWTVPSNYETDYVKVKVKPVAKTDKQVTTGSGKSKKTKNVAWWTREYVSSDKAMPSNVSADNKSGNEKAQAAKSGASSRSAGDKSYKAALEADRKGQYATAVRQLAAAAKSYGEAATHYAKAGQATVAADCRTQKAQAEGMAKSIGGDYTKSALALAKNTASDASALVSSAARKRASYDFAGSRKDELAAQAKYTSAANLCDDVASFPNVADERKKTAQQNKSAYSSAASSCGSRANSDQSSNTAKTKTPPDAPSSASVTETKSGTSCKFKVTCSCSAPWAAYVQVRVSVDGGAWKDFSGGTVSKKIGAAAPSVTAKYTGKAGHKYRFALRALLSGKKVASAWVYTDTESAQPTAPKNLALSVLSSDSVKATWANTCKSASSIEVQYSTWYQGGNAWAQGATGEVTTVQLASTATAHTITGLEPGTRLYVRVRAVNSVGSAWATVKGSASALTASAVPPKAKVAAAALDGLKLTLLADGETVRVEWSGAIESGASCAVEHTSRADAFANNVASAIESESYAPQSASAKSHALGVVVEKGAKHWFRVTKTLDGQAVRAKCATGAWRASDYVAAVVVPAASAPALSVPASVSATSPYEGALRLEWADTCAAGEAYEVQHTANAFAFADNAAGDITSSAFDEPSAGAARQVFTVTGLDGGATYWARVRKKTSDGAGEWSAVVECTLDPPAATTEALEAPTPVRCEPAYPADGAVTLGWTHNSGDGSAQSGYELKLAVSHPDGDAGEEVVEGGSANAVEVGFEAHGIGDGDEVTWSVRTSGAVEGAFSPWSAAQSFRVIAPPVAGVSLANGDSTELADGPVTSLPLRVLVSANLGAGDAPVLYRAAIVSLTGHDAVDDSGTASYVAAGDVVWSGTLSPGEAGFGQEGAEFAVSGRDVMLDSGERYAATAEVYAASGMSAASPACEFGVEWGAEVPDPDGTAVFDFDDYTCRIFPACWLPEEAEGAEGPGEAEDAQAGEGPDDEIDGEAEAIAALGVAEGEVYVDGEDDEPYYTASAAEDDDYERLRPETELDVYRIDSDGGLTLIAEALPNNGRASCTDPHPTFGVARYRIVAHDTAADVQASCEVEVETPVTSLVVTWAEQWLPEEDGDFEEYAGLRAVLPHGVELEESPAVEAASVQLAGDPYPTAYVGEAGEYANSYRAALLELTDEDTVAALRLLAAHRGAAYVRDPTGLGFWALVRVRFSHSMSFRKRSVSLEVTRVQPPKEAQVA